MMRKRKNIVITILIIIIFLFNYPINITASENYDNPILDSEFIYYKTENLSNIVNGSKNSYPEMTIEKGRAFGSEGEQDAAKNIEDWMINEINLGNENVTTQQLTNTWYPGKLGNAGTRLDTKIEIKYKNLSYYNGTTNNYIDYTEFYIAPSYHIQLLDLLQPKKTYDESYDYTDLTLRTDLKKYREIILEFLQNPAIDQTFNNYTTYQTPLTTLLKTYTLFEDYYNFSFQNYDINDNSTWPEQWRELEIFNNNFVYILVDGHSNPNKPERPWDDKDWLKNNTEILYYLIKLTQPCCKGIILYDINNETYDMNYHPYYTLPFIYINGTLGKKLDDHKDTYKISYKHIQERNTEIDSSNVIGTITGQDTSKTIIISCLYDSWWCQGTGDSAIGISIVLAIAKYMKQLQNNYKITPRYNIKFIAFSGEEYGLE